VRLIGNEAVIERLERALRSGRLAHAYLFLGPPGVGKRTAARLLAQACNCMELPAPGSPAHPGLKPCGTCRACRWIANGRHPDVIELEAGSATGQNVSIEQARELRAQVALQPTVGRRRFFLLPSAEQLSEAAANALLKTLEEPPDYATLVLAAPGPAQVLPTIRSRCQMVRFGITPPAALATALQAEFDVPADRAVRAARYAGGRPGVAIEWLQAPDLLEQRERATALFLEAIRLRAEGASAGSRAIHALRLAEAARALHATEDGETAAAGRAGRLAASAVIDAGLHLARDLALLASGAAADALTHRDREAELRRAATTLGPRATLWYAQQITETGRLLERNVTPALALERLFLDLLLGDPPAET